MNKTIEKYVGSSYGQPAPGNTIPVNTPLAEMQRKLNRKKVEEYIVLSKGVDWNLFGYATAVRFPNGDLKVINGQHRIEVVKEVLPGVKEVPAHIINVTDAQYAAGLFDKMNGAASATLKSEEQFFARIHAGDTNANALKTVLEKTSFSVGQVNDLPGNRAIKYANFVKCVKFSEIAFLQAAKVIDEVWPDGPVDDNLLSGMARLFSLEPYTEVANPSRPIGGRFIEWLKSCKTVGISQKQLAFKSLRNAGPWYDAAAYGLARSFFKRERSENRPAPKVSYIKSIWESHAKDEEFDSLDLLV